ncbi:MAG: hypothetical protein EPO08_20990 [Rhodospirillaceae bacterium]|nr:MAG: hypothetical protein EPO08_20990 [Rhodospirillaceae bacterium]
MDDLDEEHVLQAYYEEAFDQMSEEDRGELFDRLTETAEERVAREKSEATAESKDDEFLDSLNKEVKSGTLRGPPKETPKKKWVPKAKPIKLPLKESKSEEPPPDIHMSFSDNLQGVTADWMDLDPCGPVTKKG